MEPIIASTDIGEGLGERYDFLNDPEWQREYARSKKRSAIAQRLTGWMSHIPIIGSLVHSFWYCLLYEGPYQTLKPRWGALTFSFLNDGMKPTLWHTWRSIVDPEEGIWPGGAPSSRADANRKLLEIGARLHEAGVRDHLTFARCRGRHCICPDGKHVLDGGYCEPLTERDYLADASLAALDRALDREDTDERP